MIHRSNVTMAGVVRAFLASALVLPAVLVGTFATMPAAANLPARSEGTDQCFTNAIGQATFTWGPAALTGIAAFDPAGPFVVSASNGSDIETIAGVTYVRVSQGQTLNLIVTGEPDTPCTIPWVVDARPANDTPDRWEPLEGRSGGTSGTTRAAAIAPEPRPAGAIRTVWYRWSGATGDATFSVTPSPPGGCPLDPATATTSVGVAVYDARNLNVPLGVGGDGVAPEATGCGGFDTQPMRSGEVTVPVTAGTDYLVGVFSSGGTGTLASQYGYTAAGQFAISWQGPNSPPIAVDDMTTTQAGTPVSMDPLANDSDPDGSDIAIAGSVQPGHGTFAPDTNGTWTYTPEPGFVGTDTFGYTIADAEGATASAQIHVDVTPAPPGDNRAPVANEDTLLVLAGEQAFVDVVANDTDPDGDALTVTSVSGATAGVAGHSARHVTYDWSLGGPVTDTLQYTVDDGNGGIATGTVRVLINRAPVAVDDAATTVLDQSATIDVAANDVDFDGNPLVVEVLSTNQPPVHGNVTSDGTGKLVYTPIAGFEGTDTFTYTVFDTAVSGTSGSDVGTVTVTVVSPPNEAPVVTTHPTDVTVTAGQVATFTAAATGVPGPTVQWQVSSDSGTTFTDLAGATSPTLSVAAAPSDDGKEFRAVFTNAVGTATSDAALLTVVAPPNPPSTLRVRVEFVGGGEVRPSDASGLCVQLLGDSGGVAGQDCSLSLGVAPNTFLAEVVIPAGTYTLHASRATVTGRNGSFAAPPDRPVNVGAGAFETMTFRASADLFVATWDADAPIGNPFAPQAQSRLLGDPTLCYQAVPLFAGPTPVTVCGTQTNPKMVRFHDLLVGPWQITQTSPPAGWAPNPTPQTWDGTTTYLTFTNRPV